MRCKVPDLRGVSKGISKKASQRPGGTFDSLTVFCAPLYHRFLQVRLENISPEIERRLKAVIKLDIINRVAEKTGVPKMKAEQAVDALFHSMKGALTRGERIELRGFGVFVVKPRKRGVGRNPRTGEEVAIPSGKTIRFKPGKDLQVSDDAKIDIDTDSED